MKAGLKTENMILIVLKMTIQVANGTYAECIDGMLMILLSTPFQESFLNFQPFVQQTHRKYVRRFCITVYSVYT